MIKRITNILLGLIVATAAFASINQLPVITINGVAYYVYQVQPGEGELAIARKLGINVKDINKHNPAAAEGLKAYQELLFPVNKYSDSKIGNNDLSATLPDNYTAKKGDSLYGICKKYGIDEAYFISLNPEAADGIKADQIYRLKPENATSNLSKKPAAKHHTIERGESLYGIAQSNGCSIEDILSINPDLDPSNYKIGQTILIPGDATDVAAKVENAFKRKTNSYVVKPNDTFYSIARNFGISIAQLQSANPGLNLLQEGMEILIPDSCAEENNNIEASNSSEQLPDFSSQEIPRIHTKEPIRIAVALPFNASVKPQPKHSKNYVDFYRGFMLAVDSFKIGEQPVAVYAYDTENSSAKAKSLKNDSLLATANIIISAGSLENCEDLNIFGKDNNINLFNIFGVRDSCYLSNKNVMQGNIPSNDLVDLAIDYAKNKFIGFTPVILEVGGAKDKLSIANRIANELEQDGVTVKRIKVTDKPNASDFKSLNPTNRYLIIPSTSKIDFAKELLKALTAESNQKLSENGTSLFGYPEWITLREKSTVTQLKKLNTYIYSRFAEPNEFDRERVESSHKRWFGRGVSQGAPSMTLTGFDVGKYLLGVLEDNRGDFDKFTYSSYYEGLQYPFSFKRVENGGYVNKSAYIIHFIPDGEIENILIKE